MRRSGIELRTVNANLDHRLAGEARLDLLRGREDVDAADAAGAPEVDDLHAALPLRKIPRMIDVESARGAAERGRARRERKREPTDIAHRSPSMAAR